MSRTATTYRLHGAPSSADQRYSSAQPVQPTEGKNRFVHLFLKPGLYNESDTDTDSEEEAGQGGRRRAITLAGGNTHFHREKQGGGIGESPLNSNSRHKTNASLATTNTLSNSGHSLSTRSSPLTATHARMHSNDTQATSISNYSIPPLVSATEERGRNSASKRLTPLAIYNTPPLSGLAYNSTSPQMRWSRDESELQSRPPPSLVAQLGEIPLPSVQPTRKVPDVVVNPGTPQQKARIPARRLQSSSASDLRALVNSTNAPLNVKTNNARSTRPRPVHYAVEGSRIQPMILARPQIQGRFSFESTAREDFPTQTRDAHIRFRQSYESDGASARQILRDIENQRVERDGWRQMPPSRSKDRLNRVDVRQQSQPIASPRLAPNSPPQISQSFDFFNTGNSRRPRKRRPSRTICEWVRSKRDARRSRTRSLGAGRSKSRDMGVQTDDYQSRSITPTPRTRQRITSGNLAVVSRRPELVLRRRSSSFGGISSSAPLDIGNSRPVHRIDPVELARRRSRRASAHRYRFAPAPVIVPQSKIEQGQAVDVPRSPSQAIHRISGDSQLSADWAALVPFIDTGDIDRLSVNPVIQRKVSDESTQTVTHSRLSSDAGDPEQFANLFFRPPQITHLDGAIQAPLTEDSQFSPTTNSQRISINSATSSFPTQLTTAATADSRTQSQLQNVKEEGSHKSIILDFDSDDDDREQQRRRSVAESQSSYIDFEHSPERTQTQVVAKRKDGSGSDERSSFIDMSPPNSPPLSKQTFPLLVAPHSDDNARLSVQDTPTRGTRASVLSNGRSVVSHESINSPLPNLDSFPLPPEGDDNEDSPQRPTLRPKVSHAGTDSTAADWISVYTWARDHSSRSQVNLDTSTESFDGYATPLNAIDASYLEFSPERTENLATVGNGDLQIKRNLSGSLVEMYQDAPRLNRERSRESIQGQRSR